MSVSGGSKSEVDMKFQALKNKVEYVPPGTEQYKLVHDKVATDKIEVVRVFSLERGFYNYHHYNHTNGAQ